MDAMVFFSIAMLVSGMIMVHSWDVSGETSHASDEMSARAAELLRVLMAASIGRPVSIPLAPDLIVQGHETISECLSAELYALTRGADAKAFDGMNEIVADALRAMSGPVMSAHLVIVHPGGSSMEPVLAIPGPCEAAVRAYSSSMDLPCEGGLLFTISLILEPATPPELVHV
jgi:hypothetical protein